MVMGVVAGDPGLHCFFFILDATFQLENQFAEIRKVSCFFLFFFLFFFLRHDIVAYETSLRENMILLHTNSKGTNKPTHSTPGRRQSKTPILSRNVDKKSIETEFSIAICRPKRQIAIENTVSIDFYPRSSIVDGVFDCRLPGVIRGFRYSLFGKDNLEAILLQGINAKLAVCNVSIFKLVSVAERDGFSPD